MFKDGALNLSPLVEPFPLLQNNILKQIKTEVESLEEYQLKYKNKRPDYCIPMGIYQEILAGDEDFEDGIDYAGEIQENYKGGLFIRMPSLAELELYKDKFLAKLKDSERPSVLSLSYNMPSLAYRMLSQKLSCSDSALFNTDVISGSSAKAAFAVPSITLDSIRNRLDASKESSFDYIIATPPVFQWNMISKQNYPPPILSLPPLDPIYMHLDPKGELLREIPKICQKYLKKQTGKLILMYSDINEKIDEGNTLDKVFGKGWKIEKLGERLERDNYLEFPINLRKMIGDVHATIHKISLQE